MRVVMFVYNDMTFDSRVLREARTLAADGHVVTVMATRRDERLPAHERRDGFDIIRVPVPHAWWTWWRWIVSPWKLRRQSVKEFDRALPRRRWGPRRALRTIRRLPATRGPLTRIATSVALSGVRRSFLAVAQVRHPRTPVRWPPESLLWLLSWRHSILGWAAAAAVAAPVADVHHGHDLTGLPGARRASARDSARLVFDSHEIFLESGRNPDRPWWARALLRRTERRWTGDVDALVTVNRAYAAVLERRLKPRRVVVVHNCPPRWKPPVESVDHLRARAGIGADEPIVLYHGAFTAHRGLSELAAAMLRPGLERAHLVYLGYGGEHDLVQRLVDDPSFGGRLHVLDAVEPDVLIEWIASADVDAIPLQRSTLNHYLCTPNKLFESLTAGVPVVVSDFPVMRSIALDDSLGPLGAVCRPDDPASIAVAIRSILESSALDRAELRARCRRAANERWNWETESAGLLELYRDLSPAALPPGPTARG